MRDSAQLYPVRHYDVQRCSQEILIVFWLTRRRRPDLAACLRSMRLNCQFRFTERIAQMNSVTVSFENPILHPCHVAAELDYLESTARNFLRIGDTARRSAASVRAIVAVARKKHRHVAQCGQCLINEALTKTLAPSRKAAAHA